MERVTALWREKRRLPGIWTELRALHGHHRVYGLQLAKARGGSCDYNSALAAVKKARADIDRGVRNRGG